MKRSRTSVLIAVALTAALGPAAMAGAAPKGDNSSDRARAEHERIVAYWTPERMRAATPRDFERLPDGSFRQVKPAKGANASKGKPGPAPEPTSPIGAEWTAGGDVDARTGKVFFTSGVSGYVCSGAVADDDGSSRALVLTAAHCVFDNARKGRRPAPGFFSNWLFVPDYSTTGFHVNCSTTEQACWTAEALVVHNRYADAGGFNSTATTYDFAFAVVGSPGYGELDSQARGSYDVETATSAGDTLAAFGYPAAAPYDGTKLTYCQAPIGVDARNSGATWSMSCDMTGGSSGGPWVKGMAADGDGGTLNSLNSYGYSGEPYMYGPKFNGFTEAVRQAAIAQAGALEPVNTRVG